ncbi:MAG TPA: hypothetical protein VGP02_02755 [Mycobacteriales bacterium]|jgi:hypothetical protein|nr:hypothetical protein [Mycobacteriales bacterium]
MPALRARTAAVLAAAALLTGGCSTIDQVTGTVDSAANTVQVCTEATTTVVGTFGRVSNAVAGARPGQLQQTQAEITAEFETLHGRLEPLIADAADADVKASLEELDRRVQGWAADPGTFLDVDKATLDQLVTGLRNACSPT